MIINTSIYTKFYSIYKFIINDKKYVIKINIIFFFYFLKGYSSSILSNIVHSTEMYKHDFEIKKHPKISKKFKKNAKISFVFKFLNV